MTRFSFLSAFIFLCAVLFPHDQANALATDWQGIDETQVRLISAQKTTGNQNELLLGLQFKMQKDWKVYWRSPGDAGYPPALTWDKSQNFKNAEMHWPVPSRFEVLGLETLGYKKEVVYPLLVQLENTNEALNIKTDLQFLTCSEICVPVKASFTMDIPAGAAQASEFAQLISQYESRVPNTLSTMGTDIQSATLYLNDDQNSGFIRYELENQSGFQTADAFVEGPVELAFYNPSIKALDNNTKLMIDAPFDGVKFLEAPLKDQSFTLTVADQTLAFETKTAVEISTLSPSSLISNDASSTYSFAVIIGFALLGGLILNLMPCVLPVLSIKVMGLVSHGGGKTSDVRKGFLASSFGILVSFWALAGALITLKLAGMSIGWGIQFQQPHFLIALGLIVIIFAANMWGLFEIGLPNWLNSRLGTNGSSNSLAGHFFSGAFATLLATPCSAPFLGTAVGFALARGPFEIITIFSALGLGLALPYLLIACVPSLATRLPKPGKWMVILRKILSLALFGTGLWIASVLWAQVGQDGVMMFGVITFSFVALLVLREQLKILAYILMTGLLISAFLIPLMHPNAPTQSSHVDDSYWQVFDEDKIQAHIKAGKTVFVDVTADWCITCQVNKKLVLSQPDIHALLTDKNTIAMKADWTNPDDKIANYLAHHQKFAIPFNAVYGPKSQDAIILPEILDSASVKAAFSKAKGS